MVWEKLGKDIVASGKGLSKMFDKGVDKYVDECGGVDDLIDDDSSGIQVKKKDKDKGKRDKGKGHKKRGDADRTEVLGDGKRWEVVGVDKEKKRRPTPPKRSAMKKQRSNGKLEVYLAKSVDSDGDKEKPKPTGKHKRRSSKSNTKILPEKDDDSSSDDISEGSNPNANPFDKFSDLVKTASYLTERAFNPFAKNRDDNDAVSEASRMTRSTAKASEVASIVDDNSFVLWDVFPNHSLLWDEQQKAAKRGKNVLHPPASSPNRPSSAKAYKTTSQVDEQFKSTLFSGSTDRYEKAKSCSNLNQGPLLPMMMSFDTNPMMTCGGMNQIVEYPNNFQVAPEAEARWQKSKNSMCGDLESQHDSRLGSLIKIPADAGSTGSAIKQKWDEFNNQGNARKSDPHSMIPGEGTSGPGWMFFLYIYLAGIIYGSLMTISVVMFFVSFSYTEPFNTERERDLFQIACLAVAAMFGWVLSSMWIAYKDRQYGWAFISSLPSIAVLGLVVVVLSTTSLEYSMVYTPSPTPSPIYNYYYNRRESRDDYYREGQWYNNWYNNGGNGENGQYGNNNAQGANGEYNQYNNNNGRNYYNYDDP